MFPEHVTQPLVQVAEGSAQFLTPSFRLQEPILHESISQVLRPVGKLVGLGWARNPDLTLENCQKAN